MSFIRYGGGRWRSRLRCKISIEDMVQSRKNPSCLLFNTTETRRKKKSLKKVDGMMGERNKRREDIGR